MSKEEVRIDLKGVFDNFRSHIGSDRNSRILFSGKFGVGKTYFLNEFFNEQKDDYEVFHLSPVNYQITSNENIIEFLKCDLLVELFKKNDSLIVENDFNNLFDLQRLFYLWAKSNAQTILDTGASYTEALSDLNPVLKLGRPLADTFGLVHKFLSFKKKVGSGERGNVDQFIKDCNIKNISETDPLSELLKSKILELKGGKQSVLILDDLERIDPDHIFRILNIFSAHFDASNHELGNKFGFDKIILVADAQNLKSIFHHRYGENTDFNGYFDKFFSIEVFHFRNEDVVANFVNEIISKFQIGDIENFENSFRDSGYVKLFLELILKQSLRLRGKEKLNLRQLFKGVTYPIPAFQKGHFYKGIAFGREEEVPHYINSSIQALVSIFGGFETDLLSTLKKIKDDGSIKPDERMDRMYRLFSPYLLYALGRFDRNAQNLNHGWNSYSIDLVKGEIVFIRTKSGVAKDSDLFFDLLVEYIEKGYHSETVTMI